MTFKKGKVIFINVKGSPSLKHIRTKIVHELVYYRFPYMEHGPAFHKPVEKIVRGKKFGPYKPKQNQKQRRR